MILEQHGLNGLSRRRFLTGVGAAVAAGSLAPAAFARPAHASAHGAALLGGPLPKPIAATVPSGVPVAPFDIIHWLLPGPEGSATPLLGLPGFGLDVDPSTVTDFHGFTAYAVVAGGGVGSDGNAYDVEFDIRVMSGEFVAEDGGTHEGTFGFL